MKLFDNRIIIVALTPASQPVGWDGNKDRKMCLKPRFLNWKSEFIILIGGKMETIKVLINKVIYFIQKYLLCARDSYKQALEIPQ